MRKGEKDVYPSPFKGHQTLEPSIGHQELEPSIGHRIGFFLHLLPSPSL